MFFNKLEEIYNNLKSTILNFFTIKDSEEENKISNNLNYTYSNFNNLNNFDDEEDDDYYYQKGSYSGFKVAGGIINEEGEFISAPMPPSFDNYEWGGYANVYDRDSFY